MFPLLYVQVRGWNRLFANGSRCVWRGNRSICHQPFLLPSGPIWDWHPGMRSHHNWWMSDWCYEWGIYALKGNKQSKVNDAAYCSVMNEARVGVGQLNSIYQNTESMHRQHHFVFASMWVITSVPHPEPYLSVSKQSEAKSSLWLQRPCLSCKATCRCCSEGLKSSVLTHATLKSVKKKVSVVSNDCNQKSKSYTCETNELCRCIHFLPAPVCKMTSAANARRFVTFHPPL